MLIDAKQIILHFSFQAVAVVNVAHIALGGKADEIGAVFRIQTEDFFSLFRKKLTFVISSHAIYVLL